MTYLRITLKTVSVNLGPVHMTRKTFSRSHFQGHGFQVQGHWRHILNMYFPSEAYRSTLRCWSCCNFCECLCFQVEATTRQKLRNPNIFVSPTRLCVRNIPVSVSDSRLKKIFLEAAGNRHARVTEVCSWSCYGAAGNAVIASQNFRKRKLWLVSLFVCLFVCK